MMKKTTIFLLLLLIFTLNGCGAIAESPISIRDFKLNTIVSITLYDSADETLLSECMKLCDKYELIFSRTNPDSELYQLNESFATSTNAIPVSKELYALLERGLYYSALSDGNFDITIAPVSSLWDFTKASPSVPDEDKLLDAISFVNYQNIVLGEGTVRTNLPGTKIDLGAIAKGYIADRLKDYLLSKDIQSAMISLGGNILCIGSKPDKSSFQIGIQKPFAAQNETILTIPAIDCSIVSSGNYERFFKQNGMIYHHILNPRTGYPYDNGLSSVTIISDDSVDGDALSTVCFSLGLEKGMALIRNMEETEAIFITAEGKLYDSKNEGDL